MDAFMDLQINVGIGQETAWETNPNQYLLVQIWIEVFHGICTIEEEI